MWLCSSTGEKGNFDLVGADLQKRLQTKPKIMERLEREEEEEEEEEESPEQRQKRLEFESR